MLGAVMFVDGSPTNRRLVLLGGDRDFITWDSAYFDISLKDLASLISEKEIREAFGRLVSTSEEVIAPF